MTQEYFASAPPEDVGQKILGRLTAYESHKGIEQIYSRWYRAWRYYYGYDSNGFHVTSAIARGGEQGELAETRVNHARALVNALLNLITAPKFVWTPRAASMDYESAQQTYLAKKVLEHYWTTAQVAKFANQAVEEAIAFTEGFVFLTWDPSLGNEVAALDAENVAKTGDLLFRNVSPWDVLRDPGKRSWESLDWVVVRTYENKFALAAKYPEQEAAVHKAPDERLSLRQMADNRQWESDDTVLYHFYHKPSAVLPFGREVKFLSSGVVLEDGALAWKDWPIVRIAPAELVGTPFGYSAFQEILGLQEAHDSLHSTILTNLSTFGVQSIIAPEGTRVPVDEISKGLRLIYTPNGRNDIQALQLVANPPDAFKYLDSQKRDMELLMGLNAVVRGEAQSDRLSGAALALLQSQALQQASGLQAAWMRALERLGTLVLRAIRKEATAPLKIGIVGSSRRDLVRETEVTGKSLGSVDQVYVELGNPIAQTSAGRFEIAQQLAQMKLVRTPEALIQVLDTGRLEPVTRGSEEEMLLVLRENQQISEGIEPPVLIHDNHMLHVQEHSATVANPSAREKPAVLEAYIAHVHQHYEQFFGLPPDPRDPMYRSRMLLLSGQQPPPPAPMPGMGMEPPPPAEGGKNLPPDMLLSDAVEAPGQQAESMLPNQPDNPATGQPWNAVDGGGAVPR